MKLPRNLQLLSRRQSLRLIAGATTGLILHSCAQSTETDSSQAEVVSASIGITSWIGNTPLHIAQEKGFFEEQGLRLDAKVFSTILDAFPAFEAGHLDGLNPVTTEAVLLTSRGVDYRVVLVCDTSVGADGILARNSVASIKDFKGRQVAVQKGGVGHFFVLQVLEDVGLSSNDITVIDVPPDTAAVAYQSGEVEIAYTFSPYMEEANAAQSDGRIIYTSAEKPGAIADLYIFKTQFVENQAKATEAFVRGILKGLDFLAQNPEEGLAIASKELGITPSELEAQLKGLELPDLQTNLAMLSDFDSDLYLQNGMENLANFLKSNNEIQETPDLSQVLEPRFVESVGASS
ncbi:ABC transporter substrate-binding protein [Oculatella sp. FACHB-28]|nr:ABC transporter substrate-binding protein [Leptolyngbya sp. FACHB-541]MBD1997289.1 ABC transporter substrate-binding protein [Leptolyngbya sp. FACHB-541]MBD2060204.1 ABC transporter substrate-binding protein [Oculatella sp. FACHB-28]